MFLPQQVEAKEVQALISGFKNSDSLYEKGIYISKEKYFCIKADDRSIYGKKVCALGSPGNLSGKHFDTAFIMLQGKEGIVTVKTKQAILVAHYPETIQPGEAAKVVEQLADYLIGVGY